MRDSSPDSPVNRLQVEALSARHLLAGAHQPYRALLRVAWPLVARILNLPEYRSLYAYADSLGAGGFVNRALDALSIDLRVTGPQASVPGTGPLIVVANHPHGLIDGLAIVRALQPVRDDARVLTTHLISSLPGLDELCLYVDPFGTSSASARCIAGLRAATRWLGAGRTLVVFPSGEVASEPGHPEAIGPGATRPDAPWHPTVARLARRTGAVVVPMRIEGGNSAWFYRLGALHPRLRTVMLPRELLNQRGRTITVRVGPPVASDPSMDTCPQSMTARFRRAVDALAQPAPTPTRTVAPIAPPISAEALAADVAALAPSRRWVSTGEVEVFIAPAAEIPQVLLEIGRLRETTFRDVGEGTGNATDLDRFDRHYLHVFAWHPQRREVIGAYRMGLTDRILAEHGPGGLYTSTLFDFAPPLLTTLETAVELGRSFVRREYQRSPGALLGLWKAIARFVADSGRYRALFGPVSISSRYRDTSQQLLMAFLRQHAFDRELGALVRSLTPPVERPASAAIGAVTAPDIHSLDAVIARLEDDGKGVPVLLRQYLKLNARLLGFNVDAGFGDALDALLLVNLADVSPAILTRYLGRDGTARFLAGAGLDNRAA